MNRDESLKFINNSIKTCKEMIFPSWLYFSLAIEVSPNSEYIELNNFFKSSSYNKSYFMVFWISVGVVVFIDLIFLSLYGKLSKIKQILDKNPSAFIIGDYKEFNDFILNPFKYGKINKNLIRVRNIEE